MKFLLTIGLLAAGAAHAAPLDPQAALENAFRPGQALTIEGQQLFVEKIIAGKLILAPPATPTAALGAFITPVDATASSTQEGRVARKMIDGSGWGESFPGIGGLIGDTHVGKLAPMFVNHESSVSATVVEVCFNNDPFDKIVEETRGGQTKLWSTNEALSGMRPYVYEGHN